MKVRYIILSAMIIIGSCNDAANSNNEIKAADSPVIDSTLPAHVQDPSTAFPQPPVTGTQTDSSRSRDSANKKGDTVKNKRPAKG